MKNSSFIAQESSQYLALKKPYVKSIFWICVYKNVLQNKLLFVYHFELQWITSAKDNVHIHIYKKEKICKTLQKSRNFKKCKIICVTISIYRIFARTK